MQIHPLDVCLNNGRNYVQAVQMVSEAARVMTAAGLDLGVLQSFGFRHITQKQVGIAFPTAARPPDEIGEAIFLGRQSSHQAWFVELEDEAPKAVIADNISYQQTGSDRPLSGTFRFECMNDLRSLLVLTTQTVKSLHAALGPEISDIWLTGMRNAALPVVGSGEIIGGLVEVENLRVLASGRRKQTLSRVAIALSPQGTSLGALVTFAFKE